MFFEVFLLFIFLTILMFNSLNIKDTQLNYFLLFFSFAFITIFVKFDVFIIIIYIAINYFILYRLKLENKNQIFFLFNILYLLSIRIFYEPFLGLSYVFFIQIFFLISRKPEKMSLKDYFTFSIYFPVFSSGPVYRYLDFIKFKNISKDYNIQSKCLFRIISGTIKIFVFAEYIGQFYLPVEQKDISNFSVLEAWSYVTAFWIYLYFNFSGICDIIIGGSRWIGITLPENFNSPFLSRSLSDYWLRWHITVSRFFIVVVSSTIFKFLTKNNILFAYFISSISTMVLSGFWHGFTLNYVIWGALNGIGLFVQNLFKEKIKLNFLVSNFLTLFFILHTMAFFGTHSIEGAKDLIFSMYSIGRELNFLGIETLNIYFDGEKVVETTLFLFLGIVILFFPAGLKSSIKNYVSNSTILFSTLVFVFITFYITSSQKGFIYNDF